MYTCLECLRRRMAVRRERKKGKSSSPQSVLPTSWKKKEENWAERFVLKIYIVVCYFSLIKFSTIELTSFARPVACCELCSLKVRF